MLAPLYCWERNIFPLAKLEVETDEPGKVTAIECRDDEWVLDYELPPLETMHLRLEGLSRVDPRHGRHGAIEVEIDGRQEVLDDNDEPVFLGIHRLLKQHDPDLILTEWGDSTLLPSLQQQAKRHGFQLALNRDRQPVQRSHARSYMSYGRMLFKGSATTLLGRLHVDTKNSFIAGQCDLNGSMGVGTSNETSRSVRRPYHNRHRHLLHADGAGLSRRSAHSRTEGGTRRPEASG